MTDDVCIFTRRTALAGTAAAAGTLALAACSSGSDSDTRSGSPPADEPGAEPLARLENIPVGTAVSAEGPDGEPILVSQPTAGRAVAFSAICTHQGCTVAAADTRLACPCHGSVFDAATGEVVNGPAERPLPSVAVHVEDGAVLPGSA